MKKHYLFALIFSLLFFYSFSQISELPYSTSFENSTDIGTSASDALTKWTTATSGTVNGQSFASNITFTRRTGRTPSSASSWYTGPNSAQDGSYYIYTESSGTDFAKAELLAIFNFNDYEDVQLTFKAHNLCWWCNFGYDIGPATARIYVYDPSITVPGPDNNGWSLLWGPYTTNQTDWANVTVDLSAYDGLNNVQIWFTVYTANSASDDSWQSDFALDNMTVSANNVRWIGSTNADWSTTTNWSNGKVPSTAASPIITNLGTSPTISSDDGSSGDVTLKNITVNSGATLTIDKEASLKLTGNYSNSGTVILNSDSSEFASIIVQGSSTGDITYNRYVNSLSGGSGWDLVGSPVDGLSISSFANTNDSPLATGGGSGGNQYAIGYYDNSADDWSNYTTATIGSAGNFDIGKGYQMATDSGATLAFTGTIATSDQTQAVQDYSGASGRIWNLVANPYPSYINANSNADGTNNVISVNGTSNLHDSYLAVYGYDADSGDGSNFTIINNTSAATYIAPGQAFMLAADNESSGTSVSFTEAMQTTTGGNDFISDTMENTEVELRIRHGETEIGSTLLFFDEGLTLGLDPGWDAGHFDDNAPIMTRLVEEDEGYGMAINAMGLDAMENAVIPLVINQAAGQEFRINLHTATIPDPNVYLEDVEEGTFTNLYEGDFVYTPTSDLEGVGRFFIHMSADTMSSGEVSTSMLNAYKEIDASYITIEGLATQTNETNVSLYNILGREVLSTTLNNNMGTQTISTVGLSAGIYVIELESGSDRLTKKLLIQ